MPKLEFTWKPNIITEDPNDYYPQVKAIDYKNDDDLIKDIAVPGSILKETELRAVFLRILRQWEKYISEGQGFRNTHIVIKPALSGKAYAPDEQWDDDKHQKYASAQLRDPFQEAAASMELLRVADEKEAPIIEEVYDRKSKTINEKITPGHTLKITGSQLKVYDYVEGQGLWLVNQATGTEYPVELEENMPTQLRADIPDDLPAGNYNLKVVNTKYSNGKTLRTTLYETVLTAD